MRRLEARRESTVRKVEKASADIAQAVLLVERALCENCSRETPDVGQELARAQKLAEQSRKRCRQLQKRLEMIVDKYSWISRRYAELNSGEGADKDTSA